MEGSERRDYVRPPVPSAEESARAGWIAPLIVAAMSVCIRPQIAPHSAAAVVFAMLVCLMVLIGLAAAVWAAYVAWGWGPRKHLMPAAIGILLNSFLVWAIISAFCFGYQAKLRAATVSVDPTQQIRDQPSISSTDRYATEYSQQQQ